MDFPLPLGPATISMLLEEDTTDPDAKGKARLAEAYHGRDRPAKTVRSPTQYIIQVGFAVDDACLFGQVKGVATLLWQSQAAKFDASYCDVNCCLASPLKV